MAECGYNECQRLEKGEIEPSGGCGPAGEVATQRMREDGSREERRPTPTPSAELMAASVKSRSLQCDTQTGWREENSISRSAICRFRSGRC